MRITSACITTALLWTLSLGNNTENHTDIDFQLNTEIFIKKLPEYFGRVHVPKDALRFSIEQVYKYPDNTTRDLTEILENCLEVYIGHLRSFILIRQFNVQAFGNESIQLDSEIKEIASLAERAPKCHKLTLLLGFAQKMFQIMVNTLENMKHYDFLESTENRLVNLMSELNVRLLILFDVYGFPNYTAPSYTKDVNRLQNLVRIWKEEFDELEKVTFSPGVMFLMQKRRAEESLGMLASYIS